MPRRPKHSQIDPEHRDPITSAPGAHPVGVGAGAGAAGVAGAAIGGAVGGPVGAMVGAAVGAFAGGLGGKAAAEAVNPTVEDEWWRDNFSRQPYARPGQTYADYRAAYQYGWQARMMHADADWSEIEPNLAAGWPQARDDSGLEWTDAQHAAKDAWDRVGPPIGSTKAH